MILFFADFFFDGVNRWQLWFENPNKAAIVFAELVILGVWLIQRRNVFLFWSGYVLVNISAFALLHTLSRGGFLACGIGTGLVLRRIRMKALLRKRKMLLVLSLIFLVVSLFCLKVHQRCSHGVVTEDASIKNRIALWSSAPAMFRAAPWGWGLGNAGDIYMKWFQPTDRQERYRTLVNSHLTWLVELGWAAGFLYLCAWSGILWLGWKMRRKSIDQGVCLGEFGCLFVGGVFSSILESAWVWVLPTVTLLIAIRNAMSCVRLASVKDALLIVGASSIVMFGIAVFPTSGNLTIRKLKNCVLCGEGGPLICLFADAEVLGGDLYMRELRNALKTRSGMVAIASDIKDVPEAVDKIVLSGRECSKIDGILNLNLCRHVLLISPQVEIFMSLADKRKDEKIYIWIGELSNIPYCDGDNRIVVFPGADQYIPQWADHILAMLP